MTLTQIRTRLNHLKRKFALPLTILRARIRDQNATPDPHHIVQTLIPQAARPALQTLLQWELPPHLSPAAARFSASRT